MKRILTAAALIPIIVYVVLGANFWIYLAVLAAVACLCYHEYDHLAAAYGFGAPGPLGYGAGLVLLLLPREPWLAIVTLALLALGLVMRGDLAKSLPRSALLLMGVVYIFGAWKCATLLRARSPHWLMFGLLLNWAGDAGAYYIGRAFGKHKMAPAISPQKSWEGAAASVVAAMAIAGAYLLYFIPGIPVAEALGLTAAANIAGQMGDLAESAMKRGAGVKDSGTLLPGHGGLLDRVDSTLFALPLIYIFLVCI